MDVEYTVVDLVAGASTTTDEAADVEAYARHPEYRVTAVAGGLKKMDPSDDGIDPNGGPA